MRAPTGRLQNGRHEPAPVELALTGIGNLENLDEISSWLGTFRLRLTIAHQAEQSGLHTLIEHLEARYEQRRAELA